MTRRLLPLLAALALTACESELDDKTAAEVTPVTEAAPADAPVAAPAEARTVSFDGASSKLEWVGAKVTRDHKGGFKDFRGTAKLAGDRLSDIDVEIDTASVFSDSDKLTGHLKDADFFDVAQFATATFKSSAVEPAQGDGGTHKITGVLDFHGVENQLTFPADIQFMPDGSAKLAAEFTIDRQEWGVMYPGKAEDLIKNEVLVKLDVVLK
ncbi:MAG: YceI family protein [Alphaproteobacteria bacterium]|nr:YceI family protein [Alphaproteobacteria bacterium]